MAESFNNAEAFAVIKTALESGALKLRGSADANGPTEAAKKDAEYLVALLDALKNPPAQK